MQFCFIKQPISVVLIFHTTVKPIVFDVWDSKRLNKSCRILFVEVYTLSWLTSSYREFGILQLFHLFQSCYYVNIALVDLLEADLLFT